MNYSELLQNGMSITMDELENSIETHSKSVEILKDVKRMRNKAGEYSTKQREAQEKREAKRKAKAVSE